jgi:hypothetical protein
MDPAVMRYLHSDAGSPSRLLPAAEVLQIASLKRRRAVLFTEPLVRLTETGRLFGRAPFKQKEGLLAQPPPIAISYFL